MKFRNKIKRGLSVLLTASMLIGLCPAGFGAVEAQAAVELPNVDMGDGAGSNTAYKWKNTRGSVESGSSFRFDLRGFSAVGQNSYNNAGLKTTYHGLDDGRGGGYPTWISPTNSVGASGAVRLSPDGNGKVQQIYNTHLGNLEARILVEPSPDQQYILVNYYIYNPDPGAKTVYLGSGADVMIGTDDSALVVKTDKGFRMVNAMTGNNDYLSTFEAITQNSEDLEITPVTTRWIGHYGSFVNNIFNESSANEFGGGGGGGGGPDDSAIAYSWKIDVNPRQEIHKRVAFTVRPTSYYVHFEDGDNDNKGTNDEPLKTIEAAVTKLQGKMGYIYIMQYPDLYKTIDIGNLSGTSITFESTNYDTSGNSVDNILTLKRKAGFTGALFSTGGSELNFNRLTLDGNKDEVTSSAPIISATAGKILLNSDIKLQNNKVDSAVGSAVNLSGSASLSVNFAEISGNVSAGKGAVNYGSTGSFAVKNDALILGNTDISGAAANVYLANGKTLTVTDSLTGKIGITTETVPTVAVPIKVVASTNSGSLSDPTYYMDAFKEDALTSTGIYVAADGTDIYLKRNGFELTKVYQDIEGNEIELQYTRPYGAGEHVAVSPDLISNYTYATVSIDQGTNSSLIPIPATGTVVGTMPNSAVVITYTYTRSSSSIRFHPNGATPVPANLSGPVGSTVNALLPIVSKYGYTLDGWYSTSDFQSGTEVTALPGTFGLTDVDLYAKWQPKQDIKFDYLVRYTNADESTVFHTSPVAQYYVTHPLSAHAAAVPGYTLDNRFVAPSMYEGVPTGTFAGNDDFSGKMPNQDTQVNYLYRVDYNSAPFTFTIKHVSLSGTLLRTDTQPKFPEDDITAAADSSIYGYEFISAAITEGADPDPALYLSGVTETPAADGSFSGKMPNQNVTIVYTYQSNGEGYSYRVEYRHNGEDIIAPIQTSKPEDDAVTAEYKEIYGYLYQSALTNPPGHGSFDAGHDYTGLMPGDNLTVTYNYSRDTSKWRTMTYRPGANGSLNDSGRSPELTASGSGTFQSPLLITDGTALGDAGCHTWERLNEKKLTPNAVANPAYKLGGWYVDTNGNGSKDSNEPYLTGDEIFTAATTVTADFVEDPDYWIDIYFASGSRGSLTSGPTTMHLIKGTTWGMIASGLPSYNAQINYLPSGWHVGGVPVTTATVLEHGKTYVIQFVQDPNIFGTDLQAPPAVGNVDVDGSGMITVYGTGEGYQYVITDLDGKIAAVQRGNDLTSSLIFHDLYPGSRYQVYEVNGAAPVSTGAQIDSIAAGNRSNPTELLVPVVESNVSILYDEEEEGKVKLVISPADTEIVYALVDKNGDVVKTKESDSRGWIAAIGSNPPTVVFPGLDANEIYTIVGVPKDKTSISPAAKLPDGTEILTDPMGDLDIPYFIIETINGTIVNCGNENVGSPYYSEAKAGDEVTIHADETDGGGNEFMYWKVLVGKAFSGKITDQDITFTMPKSNVVICAYYERPAATPSNATVVEEVRGGNENEMALEPSEIPALEDELTTDDDRDLMTINNAKVTYKVVFDKNSVKGTELNVVKAVSTAYDDHPDAFTGAWGLDVFIERYVNGRKAGVASPSDASFEVIVQLDDTDVDMMDYEFYRLVDDGFGGLTVVPEPMDADPEETGGLFRFTAEANSRYVMVYSKAYKVTALNQTVPPPYLYRFKVRKGEAISDTTFYDIHYFELLDRDDEWSSECDWIGADGSPHTWTDNDGVWHDYRGFSSSDTKYKEYDFDKLIKKPTILYAYYDNNRQAVLDKRKELEQAVKDAIDLSEDYFLTIRETEELKEIIRQAEEVLNQTNRKANYDELNDAIRKLLFEREPYEEISDDRHDDYDDKHSSSGSGSKGGSGGGGGSGSGTKQKPYIPVKSNTYTVGVNGAWEQKNNGKWAFALNGGTHLNSMWAWLVYSNGETDKTGWYHFNSEGNMDDGWFRDEALNWYYCDTVHDGGFGKLKMGWHFDPSDGRWYYLDSATGMMLTSWQQIDGVWYYFTDANKAETYAFDHNLKRWYYLNGSERPLGSMYAAEVTPDGYQVNANGAWIN